MADRKRLLRHSAVHGSPDFEMADDSQVSHEEPSDESPDVEMSSSSNDLSSFYSADEMSVDSTSAASNVQLEWLIDEPPPLRFGGVLFSRSNKHESMIYREAWYKFVNGE